MTRQEQALARFVEPPLPEARLAREWAGVQATLRARPGKRMRLRLAMGAAAAGVLLAAGTLLQRGQESETMLAESATLEGHAAEPRVLALADGSRVEMAPAARLTLAQREESVGLMLTRGRARFQVTKRPQRIFTVRARDVDVVVRGTRFVVEISDRDVSAVRVTVEEGRVEVQAPGAAAVQVLSAGQSWETPRSQPDEVEPARIEPRPTRAPERKAAVERAAPKPAAPPDPARALFEVAADARRRGRFEEAAAALERLRREFRSDARAGLAAFELGRVRLDALGDPAGALDALDDALRLAPRAPFREDAEARRVEALERVGAVDRCRAARADYLARHPSGMHVATVARRCRAQ